VWTTSTSFHSFIFSLSLLGPCFHGKGLLWACSRQPQLLTGTQRSSLGHCLFGPTCRKAAPARACTSCLPHAPAWLQISGPSLNEAEVRVGRLVSTYPVQPLICHSQALPKTELALLELGWVRMEPSLGAPPLPWLQWSTGPA